MQQPPQHQQQHPTQPLSPQIVNDSLMVLTQMMRQLERLDERIRDLATRADLEALRKELVSKDSLDPQLTSLRTQILQVDKDRIADKEAAEKGIESVGKRIEVVKGDQMSRVERLWTRLGQLAGIIALAIMLLEFLAHIKWIP